MEIRKGDKLVHKSISEQFGQGEAIHFIFSKSKLVISDDCLISLKYLYANKLYPVLRFQMNTNFIFNNFIRFQMQEIDIVSSATSKYVFMDMIVKGIQGTYSDLSQLTMKKEVKVCEMIREVKEPEEENKEKKLMKIQKIGNKTITN